MEEVVGTNHSRTLQAKLDIIRFFQPDSGDKVRELVTEIQEKIGDGDAWLSTKTSLASILFDFGYMAEAGSLLDSFIDQAFKSQGSTGDITDAAVWYRASVFGSLGQLDDALALIRERLRVQGQETGDFAVARFIWLVRVVNAASGNGDEILGL
jgi:hypothetical protein